MKCRFHAFPLVKLLVVIATGGGLLALLLPAVQSAREAARRIRCQDNLKPFSVGLLHHESSHNVFPPSVQDPGQYSGSDSAPDETPFEVTVAPRRNPWFHFKLNRS